MNKILFKIDLHVYYSVRDDSKYASYSKMMVEMEELDWRPFAHCSMWITAI